jgi:DNA-binding transcriptional LysR family regulator
VEQRDIETFLALSEELHYGRTADRLHVSPTMISKTIKKLERIVGAKLFDRTSRRVDLTPIGRQLYEDVAPCYRQIQASFAGSAGSAGNRELSPAAAHRERPPAVDPDTARHPRRR